MKHCQVLIKWVKLSSVCMEPTCLSCRGLAETSCEVPVWIIQTQHVNMPGRTEKPGHLFGPPCWYKFDFAPKIETDTHI
ncbi:hypothetical protein SETIT_2G206700v2 [Setaria italica]|uniref:Uncharacterized protein n=1 Tax=Setaria italica TaxID=4555 RepID=A0A368Q1Y6_SETIT|nr:hypothetical protein SETIT_2G206700v2 [Setaria italica]